MLVKKAGELEQKNADQKLVEGFAVGFGMKISLSERDFTFVL